MGRRKAKQQGLWISTAEMPRTAAHPYYNKVNEVLREARFDQKVEQLCRRYYQPVMGRPSMAPGVYFRMLLVGYMEGIDSERGIAWRVADSLSLREFLGYGVTEQTPDHSTVSRTRRLYSLETHKAVFRWMVKVLGSQGLLDGQTVAIDATTLEANAAMRSIRRRDDGRKYEEYLKGLAEAEGIEEPTREQLARLDRKRKKKASNKEWMSPNDPEARITKMKDGRTHLAHKAEHAVDLASGAIVAVTVQGADQGDTTGIHAAMNLIVKPWMGGIATEAMVDFLRYRRDEVIEQSALEYCRWLLSCRFEDDEGLLETAYEDFDRFFDATVDRERLTARVPSESEVRAWSGKTAAPA